MEHFSLIALQDFYYKYRDVDVKYVDKCIAACIEDIKSLVNLQIEYRKQEIERINRSSNFHSKDEINTKIVNVECFPGRIPAFNRLVIIYEKNKRYNDAWSVCDQAIRYYTSYGMPSASLELEERKEKLQKKVM